MNEHLSAQEAADRLGISVDTLRAASDRGEIPCWRTPGGHRRYSVVDIEAVLEARTS